MTTFVLMWGRVRTWHGLDIVRRMHGHHLCIYPYAICVVWIETLRKFHKRQRRLTVRVKVLLHRIRPEVHISLIETGHPCEPSREKGRFCQFAKEKQDDRHSNINLCRVCGLPLVMQVPLVRTHGENPQIYTEKVAIGSTAMQEGGEKVDNHKQQHMDFPNDPM